MNVGDYGVLELSEVNILCLAYVGLSFTEPSASEAKGDGHPENRIMDGNGFRTRRWWQTGVSGTVR